MGKGGGGGKKSSSSSSAAAGGKKGGKADEVTLEIDPATVYFTHARIRPQFSGCCRFVKDTLAEIVEGRLLVSQLPLITLTSGAADGLSPPYFSLNNRRLWVLKELRARGLLRTIPARIRPTQDSHRLREKYTIEKCSLTAKFIREKPAGGPASAAAAAAAGTDLTASAAKEGAGDGTGDVNVSSQSSSDDGSDDNE